MSTPVRGADGPLGYAPRWARGSGSGRDAASDGRARSSTPVQELPQDLRRIAMPMPPREAVPALDNSAARDFFSPRETAETAPLADAAFEAGAESASESAPRWEAKLPRASATVQPS